MRVLMALVVVGAVAGRLPLPAAGEERLCVGVASVDITPPIGSGQHRGRSTGAADRLHAKAMVFVQGDRQAALVVCDLCKIWPDLSGPVRDRAAERTGIPRSNLCVAATHTHTGPLYREMLDSLTAKIAQAVIDAHAAVRPVTLHAAAAVQPGVAFNRRFVMRDGTVRFNPGFQNPAIERPAGPVDHELGILLIRDLIAERPLAALTNFAMHLDTVGGTRYSADYPYFLECSLRETFGGEFLSVFATGACGNVNHHDVSGPRPTPGHEGITRKIGRTLAATVQAQLPNLDETQRPALAVRRRVVDVPLQQYTEEELAWAERSQQTGEKLALLPWVKRLRILDLARMRERSETMPLEVQVLRLGENVAIVGLPGELFVELGMAVKRTSPFATTLIVELANDASPNYVPNRAAYAQGGYEVINSRVEIGGGEMLVAAAAEMLDELAPSPE